MSAFIQGGGDVFGPAGATDGDVAVFNGATGKVIKGVADLSNKRLIEPQIVPAAGATVYRPSGMVYYNITAVLSPAGSAVTPLHVYTVPAGMIARTGDCLRMTTWFRTAGNANSKSIAVHFEGASAELFLLTSAINAGVLQIHVEFFRASATTMRVQNGFINAATLTERSTVLLTGCDFSMDRFFRTVGAGPTAGDVINDVTMVEFLPAP